MSFQDRPFSIESELREHLANNLELIEPGLTIHRRTGSRATEFKCPLVNGERLAGRIDIFAKTFDKGYCIVECKMTADASALGQLLGYFAWFRSCYPTFKGPLRGAIVAAKVMPSLTNTLRLFPFLPIAIYIHPNPNTFKRIA